MPLVSAVARLKARARSFLEVSPLLAETENLGQGLLLSRATSGELG